LEALIAASPAAPAASGLTLVNVDEIAPNPHQPRMVMDVEALQGLTDSIREHGLIQPLIVTRNPQSLTEESAARYQLIAGERRWQAARRAGLEQVPVIVKEATPQQMLELALVENIQRADLNPLEEAAAYRHLVEDFGLTQEQVAEKVGRNRVSVTNSLRLLRLPEPVKRSLAEGRISAGHARALLGLESAEGQIKLLQLVEKRALSVRQTEEAVRRLLSPHLPQATSRPASADTAELEKSFRAALGTRVSLTRSRKGGKLVIYFYSEEELQSVYDVITGSKIDQP
jgi:ParB family chromosome partitioning protein